MVDDNDDLFKYILTDDDIVTFFKSVYSSSRVFSPCGMCCVV